MKRYPSSYEIFLKRLTCVQSVVSLAQQVAEARRVSYSFRDHEIDDLNRVIEEKTVAFEFELS